jgi:short-subunit dehydrogenase
MRDLAGRCALVTGASGGLGRPITRALARTGVNLAICARHQAVLDELTRDLRRFGSAVRPFATAAWSVPGKTVAVPWN